MKKLLTCFHLILCVALFAQQNLFLPQQVGINKNVTNEIDKYFISEVNQNKIGGAVVLVSRGGKVFHFKSYGWRDKNARAFMTDNSIFNIASMTKTFVTLSILILKDEGFLKLDDPISDYIPEIAGMKVGEEYYDSTTKTNQLRLVEVQNAITIRHLLSHNSGFMSGWLYKGLIADQYNEAAKQNYSNLRELIVAHTKIPLGNQPGEGWKYDFSTNVLAYLIEILSKKSVEVFFNEKIFSPLKIYDTGYNVKESDTSRVVQNYYIQNNQLVQDPWAELSDRVTLFQGTHGMWSTAQDYFDICQMILNRGTFNGAHIVNSSSIEEIFSTVEIGKDGKLFSWLPGYGFGLGFAIRVDNKKCDFLGSEGEICWFGSHNTAFWIDPKSDLVGIVLTHLPPTNYYKFSKDVRNIVYSSITGK